MSYVSRSFSRSHAALKGNHSAVGGRVPFPVYRRAGDFVSTTRAACSVARTSIHMIAGRRASPPWSRATTVIVVAS